MGYCRNELHHSKGTIYKKLRDPNANFQQLLMMEHNNEHLQDVVLPGVVILANLVSKKPLH